MPRKANIQRNVSLGSMFSWRGALVAGVVVLIVGIAIVASQIGNIGIRRVSQNRDAQLQVSSPMVPGVQTVIRWTAADDVQNQPVTVRLRVRGEQHVLAQTSLTAEAASVRVPCNLGGEAEGSVVMTAQESDEVLGWQEVEVLAPGRDCVGR